MGNNKTVRHNHLERAPLPLASYEREIFMGLLACLTADMVEFPQTIRISVKEVTETDAPNDTHYELIEKACRALFGRAVSLLPPNATRDDVDLVRIVQAIRHCKDTGYIEAMFANKITPYLLELREWQFHLAEQKPAHATTERKQHPGVRVLEFFLQPENTRSNTPLMKIK